MTHTFKQALTFCAALLGLWVGLKLLFPLLFPFFLGTLLALAADPAAAFLKERCRLPRALAAGLSVSALVAGLGLLALLLAALAVSQLTSLSHTLPALAQQLQTGAGLLENWLMSFAPNFPQGLRDGYREAVAELFSGSTALLGTLSSAALGTAGSFLAHLPSGAVTLGTGLISGYMICAKLPTLRRWVRAKIPGEKLDRLLTGWQRLNRTGKLWLLSQLKLMGVSFCVLLLGFLLLRIGRAPLNALLVSLVDALPVLGTGTVLLPWALVCFVGGQRTRGIGLLGVYLTAALLRSSLEPRLVGSHLGLDPLATLIALYCGFRLWGLGGMLLLPLLTATVFQVLPEK